MWVQIQVSVPIRLAASPCFIHANGLTVSHIFNTIVVMFDFINSKDNMPCANLIYKNTIASVLCELQYINRHPVGMPYGFDPF